MAIHCLAETRSTFVHCSQGVCEHSTCRVCRKEELIVYEGEIDKDRDLTTGVNETVDGIEIDGIILDRIN